MSTKLHGVKFQKTVVFILTICGRECSGYILLEKMTVSTEQKSITE
jgi:hypothetical protein